MKRGNVSPLHGWLCRSARWRKTIQRRVPWVISGADLGQNVLELGPGPGLTTDLLRLTVQRITAIEVDSELAESLSSRLRGSNVEVVAGDATAMPFSDAQFSGGVSFTMLHHVPSREWQDKLLREVWRVIKPGGVFVGSDSLESLMMRLIHLRPRPDVLPVSMAKIVSCGMPVPSSATSNQTSSEERPMRIATV